MILGIGNDIVKVERIEGLLKNYGVRFTRRVFATEEIQKAESRKEMGQVAATYAKRFAAKEACAKALGTGFTKGVYLKDIIVNNDEQGKPTINLQGGALEILNKLTPKGLAAHIHVSITDDAGLTQAFVVIEAR